MTARRWSLGLLVLAASPRRARRRPPPRRRRSTTPKYPGLHRSRRRRTGSGRLPRSSAHQAGGAGCRPAICAPPSATSTPRSSSRRRSIRPRSGSATSPWRSKKHKDALLHFDRAVVVNPRYAPALGGRAEALLALGEETEALQSIEAALQADPSLIGAAHARRGAAVPRPAAGHRRPRASWRRRVSSTRRAAAYLARDRGLAGEPVPVTASSPTSSGAPDGWTRRSTTRARRWSSSRTSRGPT